MNFAEHGKRKDYGKFPELLDIHVARMVEAHRLAPDYMTDTELLKSGTIVLNNFLGSEFAEPIAREIRLGVVKDGKCPSSMIDGQSRMALGSIWAVVQTLFKEHMYDEVRFKFDYQTYRQHLFNQPDDNDEQKVFHSDTFFPCVKFWYFPEKVTEGAFWYVPHSPVLTEPLIEWHKQRVDDLKSDRMEPWRGPGHREGSFRISEEELAGLGYKPVKMEVEADTLVVANTNGFHKRGQVSAPTHRVSIHGNLRIDNPFGNSK